MSRRGPGRPGASSGPGSGPSTRVRLALATLLACALAPAAWAQATGDTAGATSAPGSWWNDDVARVLAGVEDHPAIRAARAAVDAARSELEGVRTPVALEAELSGTRVELRPPVEGAEATWTPWEERVRVTATLRPFVAGDLADLEDQHEVSLFQARWTLRETRASLQAAALSAAAGVRVAEVGVAVAERGLELAAESARAAAARSGRGAATEHERERARLDRARAEERLRAAGAALREARAGLAALTGLHEGLDEIPTPPAVTTTDPGVVRAEADLTLARIGLRSAGRALAPTAFLDYAHDGGDGSLGLSIESRTWQPTVTYRTPGALDGAGAALGTQQAPPDPGAEPSAESRVTVGVQVSLSGEAVHGRTAAETRVEAAWARVEAARRDAELADLSRDEAVRAARAELDFARRERDLVASQARDARRRLELGLEAPLAVASEELALARAELALLAARDDLLSALLRGYRELAVPLSEVRP